MARFVLVVLAVMILSQFETQSSGCTVSAQTGCTPCIRPDPDPNKKVENKPANVTDLTLSTESLRLRCRPGSLPQPDRKPPSASMIVDVGVTALDPEDDILTYNYMVSGGKIIGTGSLHKQGQRHRRLARLAAEGGKPSRNAAGLPRNRRSRYPGR